MAICVDCGGEVDTKEPFCRSCEDKKGSSSNKLRQIPLDPIQATVEDYTVFIGKRANEYLERFKRLGLGGVDKFCVIWHWPAFLVPFFWFSYRGLYSWALVAFLLNFIVLLTPFIGFFLSNVIFGLTANYIYYKYSKKKILNIKRLQLSSDIQREKLTSTGGVSREAVVIPVVAMIVIAGIAAAIVIPQLNAIRRASFSSDAHETLRNAATAQEAYFVDAKCYAEAQGRITGSAYGFFPSQKVTVAIIGASSAGYTMSSYHAYGGTTWSIAGPGGDMRIKEVPRKR